MLLEEEAFRKSFSRRGVWDEPTWGKDGTDLVREAEFYPKLFFVGQKICPTYPGSIPMGKLRFAHATPLIHRSALVGQIVPDNSCVGQKISPLVRSSRSMALSCSARLSCFSIMVPQPAPSSPVTNPPLLGKEKSPKGDFPPPESIESIMLHRPKNGPFRPVFAVFKCIC